MLHADRMAIVSQREVGADTADVIDALRRVARQDADVIFISDLVDPLAVSEALSVAAAGRLVIGVMNTLSVIDTLSWVIDRQEQHAQEHTRQLLARVLRGIICQRLVDRSDGRGRVAVVESVTATPKVRDAIATGADPALIERLMSEGDYHGMATFDQALFNLFSDDLVSLDEALECAAHPEDFRIVVQQAGLALGVDPRRMTQAVLGASPSVVAVIPARLQPVLDEVRPIAEALVVVVTAIRNGTK